MICFNWVGKQPPNSVVVVVVGFGIPTSVCGDLVESPKLMFHISSIGV